MAKVLNRYLFLECLPPLGISVAVFSFVLLMHRLLLLSDLVLTKGVAVIEVLQLLALAFPGVLSLLFPASLLLAVLFAVGRLSADSEIVAMRACGVGLAQNLRPVMLLAAGACALTAVASVWAQPFALRSFREFLYDSLRSRISLTTPRTRRFPTRSRSGSSPFSSSGPWPAVSPPVPCRPDMSVLVADVGTHAPPGRAIKAKGVYSLTARVASRSRI